MNVTEECNIYDSLTMRLVYDCHADNPGQMTSMFYFYPHN